MKEGARRAAGFSALWCRINRYRRPGAACGYRIGAIAQIESFSGKFSSNRNKKVFEGLFTSGCTNLSYIFEIYPSFPLIYSSNNVDNSMS
jgi:hypothetical protein